MRTSIVLLVAVFVLVAQAMPSYVPGTCLLWGDPHFTTFDGTQYAYQGTGWYALMVSPELGIEGKFDDCGGDVSCLSAIRVSAKDPSGTTHKLFAKMDSSNVGQKLANKGDGTYYLQVTYDNTEFSDTYPGYSEDRKKYLQPNLKAGANKDFFDGLSMSYDIDGGYYYLSVKAAGSVLRFGIRTLIITPAEKGFARSCGLCGTWDSIANNDFVTSAAKKLSAHPKSTEEFADSWAGWTKMFECPSKGPTPAPSAKPTAKPPTNKPSNKPSVKPSATPNPTPKPSTNPTSKPATKSPTATPAPTQRPTTAPGDPTGTATPAPSAAPTSTPAPSDAPSAAPTATAAPTDEPTEEPEPTEAPEPTEGPTTKGPTEAPQDFYDFAQEEVTPIKRNDTTVVVLVDTTAFDDVIAKFNNTDKYAESDRVCTNAGNVQGSLSWKLCMSDVLTTDDTSLAVDNLEALIGSCAVASANGTFADCAKDTILGCLNGCNANGQCIDNKCDCDMGYEGEACEIKVGLNSAETAGVVTAGAVAGIAVGAAAFVAISGFGAKKGYDYLKHSDSKMSDVHTNPLYAETNTGGTNPFYANKA